MNQKLSVAVYLGNCGKSPAIQERMIGKVFFGRDALDQVNRWFETIVPRLGQIPGGSLNIMPPWIPSSGEPVKGQPVVIFSSDKVLTADDVAFVAANNYSAVVGLRTGYYDTSGNFYRSDGCYFHAVMLQAMAFCEKHNEIH